MKKLHLALITASLSVAFLVPIVSQAAVIQSQGDASVSSGDGYFFEDTIGTGYTSVVGSLEFQYKLTSGASFDLYYQLYECSAGYSGCSIVASSTDQVITNTNFTDSVFPLYHNGVLGYQMVASKYYKVDVGSLNGQIVAQRINVTGSQFQWFDTAMGCNPGGCINSLKTMYFRLFDLSGSALGFAIQFPVDGLYAPYNFASWSVSVPPNEASSSVEILVSYGQQSGIYQYTDRAKLFYSAVQYSVYRNTGVDLTLGNAYIPHNWYAQARLYADYDGSGSYSSLVDTSTEIKFTVYPNGIQTTLGSSTQLGYLTFSGTSTCPNGLVCTAPNGQQFYIDQNGNIVPVQATSTINSGMFGKFYALWQPLEYKIPWGYFTLLQQVMLAAASSTATTTMFQATTSSSWITIDATTTAALNGYTSVLGTPLSMVRHVFAIPIYVLTGYMMFKILALTL